MTWAPVAVLAMVLDMAREMNDPPMPKTRANTSMPLMLRGSTPMMLRNTLKTTMIARFVVRKRTMRFIAC